MLYEKRLFQSGKVTFIICTLSIFCLIKTSFCQENTAPAKVASTSIETVDKNEKTDSDMWQTIWGQKAQDAILLEMVSCHLSGSGNIFGSGDSEEHNQLLGVQYYGLTAGTFINSHHDRSFLFGVAREVYTREIAENTRLDIGYNLGLLEGYGSHLPNLCGLSLYGAATLGLSWHRLGFDIGIIPIGVITGNFRINF
jgi:hypothetical protein